MDDINKNYEKIKNYLNNETNNPVTNNEKQIDDYILVSNNLHVINSVNSNITVNKKYFVDEGVDTSDLLNDGSFDFENLKKNYLNNMISWSFLKKISEFNQWPLGCIGNFLDNCLKEEVGSKNIYIGVKCYDKKVYSNINNGKIISISKKKSNNMEDYKDFTDKIIVLSISDDGSGIVSKEFNQILFSFSINEKKEYNFFRFGVSMKASAIRLANSFLLISKTEDEASIGLISKNLQIKLETDFIMTPIVNFKIDNTVIINTEFDNFHLKYIPRSSFPHQSLNLILNETKFLFDDSVEFYKLLESFDKGTHLYLYDLKQLSPNKNEINKLNNYELIFDHISKDILFNYFQIQVGETNFIDCSLTSYLKFLYLKPIASHTHVNIFLFDQRIPLKNPFNPIYNVSKQIPESIKIHTNLKCDASKANSLFFEGEIYKGLLFNENYFKSLSNTYNFNLEYSLEEKEIFNGILIYKNNRLVCRFGQSKLGDISFYIKKYQKENSGSNIFPISGYVEVPSSFYELLYNKLVLKCFYF
jgi:hypothetical protein